MMRANGPPLRACSGWIRCFASGEHGVVQCAVLARGPRRRCSSLRRGTTGVHVAKAILAKTGAMLELDAAVQHGGFCLSPELRCPTPVWTPRAAWSWLCFGRCPQRTRYRMFVMVSIARGAEQMDGPGDIGTRQDQREARPPLSKARVWQHSAAPQLADADRPRYCAVLTSTSIPFYASNSLATPNQANKEKPLAHVSVTMTSCEMATIMMPIVTFTLRI